MEPSKFIVSQEVHHIYFRHFIEFGSTTLHDRHVAAPINFEEAKRHIDEFTIAGIWVPLDHQMLPTSLLRVVNTILGV